MRIYQVPKFRYGYTFIELLVVIIIIGLFFYLVFPTIKNIIPEEGNEKISGFVDIIEKSSRSAIEQKEKIILIVDLDTNSYAVMPEKDMEREGDEDGEEAPLFFTNSPFIFIKAKNSSTEVSTGLITFLFFPDGSKEFGLIFVKDMEDIYTIFLNPYTISPEVIKGEVKLEED
ncbi:MAG: prepilin-type N-terminal cleavage/methylation domain-containing protein [Candidatus Omnitrophica bacterium]|nr:prepilin-type N-terminal cleavage/methylation domain-containing protein [Candidatus Omnitrophota bacterium]MCM8777295.1 prepilin-type N-terminal cleavage/methylation domain-containing protein [Candidatus Omnitrophota bacterium]